jgi:hypothetical protein
MDFAIWAGSPSDSVGDARSIRHGRSLKLAAFAILAGPPDLLTRFVGHGSQHARRTQNAKDARLVSY